MRATVPIDSFGKIDEGAEQLKRRDTVILLYSQGTHG